MGTVAAMFKTLGLKVTGSDQAVYPPMSDFLRDQGVIFHEGYAEKNLSPKPDLAIVGNALSAVILSSKLFSPTGFPLSPCPNFSEAGSSIKLVISWFQAPTAKPLPPPCSPFSWKKLSSTRAGLSEESPSICPPAATTVLDPFGCLKETSTTPPSPINAASFSNISLSWSFSTMSSSTMPTSTPT